ncbi:MAG: response regulator transcription factor [Clostridia bacterium]|nr:response regulator transcription factor [Clostridia bacterium]
MDTDYYNKIKVLVVDDHPVVGHGTVSLLSSEPCFSVVGMAISGQECLQLVAENKPDIVLLDINLPDTSGINLIEKLREVHPQVNIIMFTGQDPGEYVADSLNKGVQGFLLKDCSGNEMCLAIKKVNNGEVYFSQSMGYILKKLVTGQVFTNKVTPSDTENPCNNLTPREIDILEFIAKGMQNKEIAAKLGIKLKTVDCHVSNILSKLEVNSRLEALLIWNKPRSS